MSAVAQIPFDFDRIDRRTKGITPSLIAAIKDRLVQHLHPKKVILFGSQASGKAKTGSDIDLLIVVGNQHPLAPLKRRDRLGKVLELFRYRSFALDVIVLTEAEIREVQEKNEGEWDLVLQILGEGKILYDSAAETQTQRTRSPADARVVS